LAACTRDIHSCLRFANSTAPPVTIACLGALLTLGCVVALAPMAAGAGSARDIPSRPVKIALATVAEPTVKVPYADAPMPAADPLRSSAPKRSDLVAEVPTAEVPSMARSADRSSAPSTGRVAATLEPASAGPPPAPSSSVAVAQAAPSVDEAAQASAILARLTAQHPILSGTTVSIGQTPNGYQAVSYYQSGSIVISSNHTVSLERILAHEIWHVIDWRDNGMIDWGENIPPTQVASTQIAGSGVAPSHHGVASRCEI